MDVTTGRWVPAGIVDPDKTEHTVTGLEPGHKYEFRVKAVNEEGESEPLQTDVGIVAKNPYGIVFLLQYLFIFYYGIVFLLRLLIHLFM